jgi:hypothetical protein
MQALSPLPRIRTRKPRIPFYAPNHNAPGMRQQQQLFLVWVASDFRMKGNQQYHEFSGDEGTQDYF